MDSTLSYSKVVERYARFFDRPEIRLRFLNNTLAQQAKSHEKADAFLQRFGLLTRLLFLKRERVYNQLLKLWLYHLIFQELSRLLPPASNERKRILRLTGRAPLASRLIFGAYQHRRWLVAPCLVLVAAALFGLYTGAAWSARRANAYMAARYGSGARAQVRGGFQSAYAQTSAQQQQRPPDFKPEKVWLVEEGEGFERYSNGARILRDFETTNRPRGYYPFRGGEPATAEGLRRDPLGIVYHTSENDMLPFTPDNSASIEVRSRGLLEYVRRHKSYNYVIDRFGQIYKIVRDEDAANHAGNSIWSDGGSTYIGLNESFLGVCFETTMAATGEERLTEAQMVAGRLLTQVLRSRYQIDDRNCVAHGIVSVNPSNMLVAFHHDWARGFPFEAFGLSDKYAVAPASVSEFGFTYDEEVLAKLGGALWPGVEAAEGEFNRRASEAGKTPEELRRATKDGYRQAMQMQLNARASSRSD